MAGILKQAELRGLPQPALTGKPMPVQTSIAVRKSASKQVRSAPFAFSGTPSLRAGHFINLTV